jgi:hypothetical protein
MFYINPQAKYMFVFLRSLHLLLPYTHFHLVTPYIYLTFIFLHSRVLHLLTHFRLFNYNSKNLIIFFYSFILFFFKNSLTIISTFSSLSSTLPRSALPHFRLSPYFNLFNYMQDFSACLMTKTERLRI